MVRLFFLLSSHYQIYIYIFFNDSKTIIYLAATSPIPPTLPGPAQSNIFGFEDDPLLEGEAG